MAPAVFAQVLYLCDRQGLIGREMFAIDGVKLPSKHKSGTLRDCVPCEQRANCLRTPEKTQVRQVTFYQDPADKTEKSVTDQMKRAIDHYS